MKPRTVISLKENGILKVLADKRNVCELVMRVANNESKKRGFVSLEQKQAKDRLGESNHVGIKMAWYVP